MNKILLLLTMLLCCVLPYNGQAQNTCAAPTNIGAIPYNSPTGLLNKHTTCNKGDDYDEFDACGNRFIRSDDYVYKFTAGASNTCINITLNAQVPPTSNARPGLFLFDGCPDVSTTNCVAQGINTTTGSGNKPVTLQNIRIKPGTVYYIVVASDTSCYPFDISVTNGTCPAADSSGSGCANAKVIPSIPYETNTKYSFTTCGKGRTYNIGNPCESYYMDGESYTFSYTSPVAQCAMVDVTTDIQNASLYIMENCPTSGDGICMGFTLGSFNNKMQQFVSFEVGKTYYFIISSYNAFNPCQNFDISVKPITLTGRVCADAIPVPSLPSYMDFQSTRCKGNDYNSTMACGSTFMDGSETVYKYTSPGNECLSATLFKLNNEAGLYLFDGCPGAAGTNCLTMDSATTLFFPVYSPRPNSIDIEYEITKPGTYYIIVSNPYPYEWSNTDYDLLISSSNPKDEGSTCETPYYIDSLNFSKNGYSTSCKGVDYAGTNRCNGIGSRGNDVVFKIKADRDGCAKILAKNVTSKAGIFLLDACPSDTTANCEASAKCEIYGCDSVAIEYTFEKGKTYYLVVSAEYGSSSVNFDLEIRPYADVQDTCVVCSEYICKACKNISFDLADFTGWTGFTGTYPTPKQTPGISSGPINSNSSRHTIMSAGSYDPVVGPDLSVVSPYGGNYSARLGNSNIGAEAEVLRYTYTVDSNTNNFYYYYAVVLQDGGHAAADQPYFQTNVFVDSSEVITCGYYEVSAAANVPGFKPVDGSFGIIWKDWALVSIPLINYVGRQVTIEFTTKDCSQGGHYGYGYIDAFCGKAEILRADKEGRPISVKGNVGFICKDSLITLTAPEGYAKYEWNNGSTGQTITIDKEGDYIVTLTSVSGCTSQISTVIKAAEDPVANFIFEQPCSGTQLGFSDQSLSKDTFNITSWNWDFGDGNTSTARNPANNFPGSGTYNVTLKVKTGANCTHEVKKTVTVKEPVVIPPIGAKDSILICTGDSILLYSNKISGATVKWEGPKKFTSTDNSPSIPKADTARSGLYIITVKLEDCENAKDTTYVTVLPAPDFGLSKDTTVCFSYTGINLTAKGGESYQWSPAYKLDGTTGNKVKTTTDSTITYSVQISNAICPDTVMKVKVKVDNFQQALKADDYVSTCTGNPVTAHATAQPAGFIEWNAAGVTQKDSLSLKNTQPAQSGYYQVKSYLGANRYCLFGTDSVYVRIHPLPVPSADPVNNLICYGDSGFATAKGAASYTWQVNGASVSTTPLLRVRPLLTTKYDLIATSDSGCTDTVDYTIQVKPDFMVSLGPDRIACEGDTLVLTLVNIDFDQQQASFLWTGGSTDTSITITKSGTYQVTAGYNGCSKTDAVKVDFQAPGSFSIGNDAVICSNDSVYVDLEGVTGTVTWTDGYASKSRYIGDPGGTYGVVVKLGTCELTDSITITTQTLHTVDIGPDSTFCLGGSVTLNSPFPSETNHWTDGPLSDDLSTFTVKNAGQHTVALQVTIGVCQNSDTAVVTVEQPPSFTLGPDTTVCEDIPVLLSARLPQAGAYRWSTGATTDTLRATQPGSYSVEVDVSTCTVKDTIVVKHDKIPVFSLGPDQLYCQGQQSTLRAPVSGTYSWSTGVSTDSITVNTTGNYNLLVKNGKCSYRDTVRVVFQAPPNVDLGNDILTCESVDTILVATQPGATYKWNDGTSQDRLRVTAAGTYGVIVTQGPCTASDQVLVTEQPLHSVSLPADMLLCQGVTQNVVATTSSASPAYLWNTGATSSSVNISTSNTYWVRVTDGVCVNSDTIVMDFVSPPVVDLGPDNVYCEGTVATLDATNSGASYLWNTGDTTAMVDAITTGRYSVVATIGPCIDQDTVDLVFKDMPVLRLMEDAEICSGEVLTIAGNIPAGLTYRWNTGDTTPQITVNTERNYILVVSDLPCVVSDTFHLTVHPLPEVTLDDTLICPTDSAFYDATCEGCTYRWSDGVTAASRWLYPDEQFEVVITSEYGCTISQVARAAEDKSCPEELFIPNSFTPNEDGYNDVFRVVAGNVQVHEVMIYNRWGEKVYGWLGQEGGWDGRYLGDVCKQDVYTCRVIYTNIYRVKKTVTAKVTLLK
jgi:gliding motility-associated-like protein